MNGFVALSVGLISGVAGTVGSVWLLRTFLGAGLQHFLAATLQDRGTVGRSDLEFRKQQLSEFYGPIYAYAKLTEKIYDIWMAGTLHDVNAEIIDLFKRQNERVIEILSTKLHLVDGDRLPPTFIHFMTSVTLWNIYTARREQPWIPDSVSSLPQVAYPKEFNTYIYETTERLKQTVERLHRKYGIT